jgi:sulfhydrogenase subunit gamma (sulfur reductase)
MKMRVNKVVPETSDIKSFQLVSHDGNWGTVFPFIPGQVVVLSLPDLKPAYFAIASAPEERGYIDVLIKQGRGASGEIFGLEVGAGIEVSNPTGKGFPLDSHKGKNLLLVSVGTAISPMRSVLRSLLHRRGEFGDVMLFQGVLTPSHFPYQAEMEDWIRQGIQVHRTVTFPENTGWTGHSGFVQNVLEKVKPDSRNTVVYLAGMKEMIEQTTELLKRMGFPAEDILLNY